LVDLLNLDLTSPSFGMMVPQLIIFGLALVLMLGDAFFPRRTHYNLLTGVSLVGYAASLIAIYIQRNDTGTSFQGVFRQDGLTVFLCAIILIAAILTVMVSATYVEYLEGKMQIGEYYVLLAFAVLGAMLTASAGDLIMVFVGIELSALATYILTAFAKRRESSMEGALKYFLLGIFASAILVYGMAWLYGLTGSTNLDTIAAHIAQSTAGEKHLEPSILLALLLLVVGLGFKIAAVPFHMWTPDAYDGAPTPVTAYMSVIPKAAGFAAIVRILIQGLGPLRDDWYMLIAILALLTMVFGNLVAISQRNVKRMLAYSSIAHTGYMMVGVAAYEALGAGFGGSVGAQDAVSLLLYYMLAYTFMNIGAFAVVAWIQHRGAGMNLEDFHGLSSRQPLAAAAMAIFMVSLMGIPPLIGFYAKYYVILAAIQADMLWLAISVVFASAISAYFYLRVVAVMYFNPAPEKELAPFRTQLLNISIAGMVVANILLGIFSQRVIDLADKWTNALTIANQVASLK
ncbi:MAG TPA: NADH-quinone oxidoreductase subunit N, partial [Thermomicrobiales bacterium]|nr:NADH-quinone oxidoreductase subunit N [Thermomicrobiales bacterium]